MTDFQLTRTIDADNPIVGDFHRVGNDLILTANLGESVAQHIRIRLLTVLGEWFLDLREGMPYYEEILVKGPNIARLRQIYRTAIGEVPGVREVPVLRLALDRATRTLTVTFQAILEDGITIDSDDFGPFIIEVKA